VSGIPWHDILTAGAGVIAVLAPLIPVFGWWVSRRLERFKHEMAEDMEKRKLRAEYVRGQIDKLYGPLAFFVESSDRHIATNRAIIEAYDQHFGVRWERGEYSLDHETQEKLMKQQESVLTTANRYMALVVANNKKSIEILGEGWGWLDVDDIPSAGQYLTDIARHAVEFEEEGRKLPPQFYFVGNPKGSLDIVSFIRPEFIRRIREKLSAKQRELAGLTGVESVPELAMPAPTKPPLPPADVPLTLPAPKSS
jgi:hypothetical protein